VIEGDVVPLAVVFQGPALVGDRLQVRVDDDLLDAEVVRQRCSGLRE
jgi:hypothetical protein